MIYDSKRNFRIWDYTISHKQMLLRSPMAPDVAENIDIVLWGVEYLELPTGFKGVAIMLATTEETMSIAEHLPRKGSVPRVFCFESNGNRYRVAASGLKVLRNQLDIFDSTLVYFSRDDLQNRGEVIATSDQAPIVVES